MGGYVAYPEYKDSGVEWLGNIPKSWQPKRLKYISTYNDESLDENTEPDYELEYVDISSVSLVEGIKNSEVMIFEKAPSRARRKVRDGDTIISTVRTYLKAIAAIRNPPDNMIVSTGFAVIRPHEGQHPDYVGYLLQADGFVGEVVANSTGVGYPAINASVLVRLSVVQPPFAEQQTIARFLDYKTARIDALIAKEELLLKKLSQKRTALISHALTKGLDQSAPMKDSGVPWLGEIPAHWKCIPLKRHLVPKAGAIRTGPFGSQLLSSDMSDYEIKVYNQRNVLDRNFDQGENYISENKYNELKAFEVLHGDLLVTTRGTIGKCAIVPNGIEKGILHPCLMRLQFDENSLTDEYFSHLLQDGNIILEQLNIESNATTIDVIYSETLKAVLIPTPPTTEQKIISEYIVTVSKDIYSLASRIKKAITKLKEYRTSLITHAVTGKIDVRSVPIPKQPERRPYEILRSFPSSAWECGTGSYCFPATRKQQLPRHGFPSRAWEPE